MIFAKQLERLTRRWRTLVELCNAVVAGSHLFQTAFETPFLDFPILRDHML